MVCPSGADDDEVEPYAGDPPIRWLLVKLWLRPYQAALATFCLGIGVMASWYLLLRLRDDPAARLKGQFDYYATYADAIVLPLTAAVIVDGYHISSRLFRGATGPEVIRLRAVFGSRWLVLLTLVAVIAGLFSFFAIPDTAWEVNWTSPAPRQLNGAGWYHAGFIFVQLYVIFGCAIRQVAIAALGWRYLPLVDANRAAWREYAACAVKFVLLLGGFAGLIVADRIVGGLLAAPRPLNFPLQPTVLGVYGAGLPLCGTLIALAWRSRPSEAIRRVALAAGLVLAMPPVVAAFIVGLDSILAR